jgi:hypothetical protein
MPKRWQTYHALPSLRQSNTARIDNGNVIPFRRYRRWVWPNTTTSGHHMPSPILIAFLPSFTVPLRSMYDDNVRPPHSQSAIPEHICTCHGNHRYFRGRHTLARLYNRIIPHHRHNNRHRVSRHRRPEPDLPSVPGRKTAMAVTD